MCITQAPVRRSSLTLLPNAALTLSRYHQSASIHVNHAQKTFETFPTPSLALKSAPTNEQDLGLTAKNHKRHIAQHNYRDHSNETPDVKQLTVKRKPKGGVTIPFPLKLHQMLDEIEKDGHASVVSWQHHGRAFVVHKQKEFVDHILPTYFRQSKFSSFQRQLNLYGFSRLFAGKDKGGYYHELFLRGKLFLADRMTRTKVKGTGVRGGSNPESEPDFYSMPPVLLEPQPKSDQKVPSDVPSTKSLDVPKSYYHQPGISMLVQPTLPCDDSSTRSPVDPISFPIEAHAANLTYFQSQSSHNVGSYSYYPKSSPVPVSYNAGQAQVPAQLSINVPETVTVTSSDNHCDGSTDNTLVALSSSASHEKIPSGKDEEMLNFLAELDMPFEDGVQLTDDTDFGYILDQIVE